MGRSARGSGSGYSRSSAPRAAPAAAPQRPAAAPAPQQQPVHNVTVVRPVGGPMMGGGGPGLMGTMAAAAAGSVAGHAISNAMFGNNHAPQPQAPPPQEYQQPQAPMQTAQQSMGPCGMQLETFNKCVEANGGNSSDCKWAWEAYSQCKMGGNNNFGNGTF